MSENKIPKIFILLAIAIIVLASQPCFGANGDGGSSPRHVFERTANHDNVMKILLYYDMEGLAGQKILTSIDFPRPEYFEAREMLTNDVNAVIDGLCEGGADSIYVVDAHGSFNPEPDIILEKMDPRAQMLFKKEKFHPYVDLLDENNYDAIVAVGMHSKTGGGGFAEHTINLGTDWVLNGMSVNESEILAYSWGRIGIPLIFVSGDDKLADQLSWMKWIEYVTVKEAAGIGDAVLYPVDQVHENLRAAAQRSLENIDKMKAVGLSKPITAELRVRPPADLSILRRFPGIDYNDQSVSFEADDFHEAYHGMRGLMDVAQSGYYDIAAGILFNQGAESFMEFKDSVFSAWRRSAPDMDDAGEISKPTPPKEKKKEKEDKLYFGSQ